MITATYLPSTNGVAIAVSNLKNSLEKSGHEVKILAPDNPDAKEENGVLRYPSIPNPLVQDYPIPLFPGVKSIYSLITSFKPDVVHVHHPFHIGFFAKIIADRFKVPLVFTFHTRYDLYAEKYATFLPNKLKKEFIDNSVYKFCKEADLIIAPSNFIKEEISKKYPYLNVKAVPVGVSTFVKTKTTRIRLREKYNLPRNKKILLSVSRLGKEKNLDILINSVKSLPEDYFLLIVGSGPDKSRLNKIANLAKIKGRIKFQGHVDHRQIADFYKLSDFFYYTSLSETQGLIFLESITYGLPVVAVKSPASLEWIKKDFGILTENSPDDLARSAVLISSKNYLKLSQAAKEYSKNFSTIKLSKKLSDSFEDVIKRKKLAFTLLDTGWQSWSPPRKRLIKYPEWNYKPNKDFYLPENVDGIKLKKPIKGWCSWYCFGKDISEHKILDQTRFFAQHNEIEVENILIDDGWTLKGDWDSFDKNKFPKGIFSTALEIRKLGFKAGIWMAPFLVDPESKFFKNNKELIVKWGGRLINGLRSFPVYDWFKPVYILDIRKSRARKIIKDNLDILLNKNKFNCIKLDFLYSIYFIPGISEKEAGYYLRGIFLYIKNKYPDVYTIACGSPLAPAIGVVDSFRFTPDIIDPYISEKPLVRKIINTYKLNLVINRLKTRKWTNKYWNLDPDVFVCRRSLGYRESQIEKLKGIVKNANGNIFLGDDFTKLDADLVNKYIKPLFENAKSSD